MKNSNNTMNKNKNNVERMIQYNNRGAFLIECGQYQKAIQCLRIGNEMLVNEMEKKHLQETTATAAGINNRESSPIFLTIDCTENSKKCRHPCTLEDNYGTGGGGEGGGGTPLAEPSSTPTTTHRRRPSKNIVNQHQHDYFLFSEHHHHHARSSCHNNAEAAGTGINMMTKTKRMILLRQDHYEEEGPEQGFISRRPMRVSCLPPERWDYILSVIFLFNLALSHQLLARSFSSSPTSNKKNMEIGHGATTTTTNIQHKKNKRSTTMARTQRERHARASLFFYQCAFTMKNRGYLHFDTSFALAMVNNTANVLFELGYKERAQKLQQLMLTTLMMVVVDNQKRNDNDKEPSLLCTIDDMEGFMATATQSMASKEGPTTAMIA